MPSFQAATRASQIRCHLSVQQSLGVTTERSDVQWMFPADADHESIDALVAVIADGASGRTEARAASASAAELPSA